MACEKCGYIDEKNEIERLGKKLCQICSKFSPSTKEDFDTYLTEKLDWKVLETFRKHREQPQKKGMAEKARQGKLMVRPPLGYSVVDGKLMQNEKSAKVHSLFKTFLEREYSLNSLAKNYGLSVNGLKKILQNRTYLGEIKFAGQIHKSEHKPLIDPDLFYAVQRKLKGVLRV